MIWFSADLHFSHDAVLDFCSRPFKNATEMDRQLIKRFNSVIKPIDTLFILGDVSLDSSDNWKRIARNVQKLNGRKHLVLGNHDHLKPFKYLECGFLSVHTSLVVNGYFCTHDPAVSVAMKHYKCLCGHVHDLFKMSNNKRVLNVGVDVWNLMPVSIDQIDKEFEE